MDRSVDEYSAAMRRKKSSLTLDLNGTKKRSSVLGGRLTGPICPTTDECVGGGGGIITGVGLEPLSLSSPECGGLLKLTTAELERFLLQPNAPLLASPAATPLLFLKPTNEEQEAYARGFMDALMEIRRKQHQINSESGFGGIVCLDASSGSGIAQSLVTLTPVSPFAPLGTDGLHPVGGFCPQLLPVNLTNSSRTANPIIQERGPQKNEQHEETVTSVSDKSWPSGKPGLQEECMRQSVQCALGNTPPQSPIDMTDQERIKLERKREKNRRAAQKCRTRKLERISRLQMRTKELREQNARLVRESAEVHEDLLRLKGQIAEHFHNGCFMQKSSDALYEKP